MASYSSSSGGGTSAAVTTGANGLMPATVYDWFLQQDNFVRTLVPTLTNRVLAQDFNDSTGLTLAGTGSTSALLAGVDGGVVEFPTTTTSARTATAKTSTSNKVISNARTKAWAAVCYFRIVTAPAGGTASLDILNITDEATADCAIGVAFSVSAANFYTLVGGASAATTTAFDTSATYHTMAWIADATNVKAYYDGALIATVAQAAAANAAPYLRIQTSNGNQSASVNMRVDKLAMYTTVPAQ